MTTLNRVALITGASAGIGACFARHLAAEGHDLLLVARREERLRELAAELQSAHNIRCHIFAADLTDPKAPAAIIDHAQAQGLEIDVLINNAGLSGKDGFTDTPWPALAGELQLMIVAVTELAHRVLPGMKAKGLAASSTCRRSPRFHHPVPDCSTRPSRATCSTCRNRWTWK